VAEDRRAFRVLWIVFALALFNLGDLLMTLEYRHVNLMVEDNSVAAKLVYHPNPWPLIIYKVCFVTIALSIFVQLRRKLLVEIAGICMLIMFVSLTIMWYGYMDAIDDMIDQTTPRQLEAEIEELRKKGAKWGLE
jgi:hypothetical protein